MQPIVIFATIAISSLALVITLLVLRHRRAEWYMRERMALIEKGLLASPAAPPLSANYLLRGLIWVSLGLAIAILFFSLGFIRQDRAGLETRVVDGKLTSVPVERREVPLVPRPWMALGLLPGSVGIAYLLYFRVAARQPE